MQKSSHISLDFLGKWEKGAVTETCADIHGNIKYETVELDSQYLV